LILSGTGTKSYFTTVACRKLAVLLRRKMLLHRHCAASLPSSKKVAKEERRKNRRSCQAGNRLTDRYLM
jgi:hypothetical protein